jgi:hypothetical protein
MQIDPNLAEGFQSERRASYKENLKWYSNPATKSKEQTDNHQAQSSDLQNCRQSRCLLAIVQLQRICVYYTNTPNLCYYKTSQCTDRPFNTVQLHRHSLKYRKETLSIAGTLENKK